MKLLIIMLSAIAGAMLLPKNVVGDVPMELPRLIMARTTNAIQRLVPEASVADEDRVITVKWKTKTQAIRAQMLDGTLSSRVTSMEVPKEGGFLITVRFRSGTYDEPRGRGEKLVLKKDAARLMYGHYLTDSVREFPRKGLYMVSQAQYTEATDLSIVEKVYQTLVSAVLKELGEER
jgi:hypothetical protein